MADDRQQKEGEGEMDQTPPARVLKRNDKCRHLDKHEQSTQLQTPSRLQLKHWGKVSNQAIPQYK